MTAVKKIQVKQETKKAALRLVRGGKHPNSKQICIEQFWTFCQACLWNNSEFKQEEIVNFKKLIADYFKFSKNNEKTLKELIERTLLVKRYLKRGKGRFLPKPSNWLNIHFALGLAGTKSWFASVERQRKTVPDYNEGIALLSASVMDYFERPNLVKLIETRQVLIENRQYDLVQIYMNAVLHHHLNS